MASYFGSGDQAIDTLSCSTGKPAKNIINNTHFE
ncbi:predicted protein [Sclerotinia sclerotiorum 1980 UF-70]|uniref:Uncharacterized protein n=1 Tax=Sclerotinia sclerotiorum (strain ATCC 18683 / 1980 / Ss-1) TaxID=665079 RepID=A7EUT6_SCLS1|nr:predicted protein [Sclerotinia sclerotiorum 1980 UF-70]EDN93228.1 predicted protein [Sclerotinia sclerotiorum 1980 UF-70]